MSCKYCNSGLNPLYQISTNGFPSFKLFNPDYCPHCGTPLTQQEPLTLEQLKQMDAGDAIWIELYGDLAPGYWGVIEMFNDSAVWFENKLHERFSRYRDTWTPYAHKPTEQGEK